jgi:hypothetical protein
MLLSGLNGARTFARRHVPYEANFHLSRFVNKQNYQYWDVNNPINLHE